MDFQEFDESSYDDDIECFKTIDQLNWKDILFHMNSKQSDGSTTIQFDNVHCLFDCYFYLVSAVFEGGDYIAVEFFAVNHDI